MRRVALVLGNLAGVVIALSWGFCSGGSDESAPVDTGPAAAAMDAAGAAWQAAFEWAWAAGDESAAATARRTTARWRRRRLQLAAVVEAYGRSSPETRAEFRAAAASADEGWRVVMLRAEAAGDTAAADEAAAESARWAAEFERAGGR